MKRSAVVLAAVVIVAGVVAGAWYYLATGRDAAHGGRGKDTVTVSRPQVRDNEPVLVDEPVRRPVPRTVESAVAALVATANEPGVSAIPRGTRLLSVVVKDGVATIDLSKEFNALGTMGDTGESLAQNALRRSLAQFPEVERMTVRVDGAVYGGEHSGEWSDIPVRDTHATETIAQ